MNNKQQYYFDRKDGKTPYILYSVLHPRSSKAVLSAYKGTMVNILGQSFSKYRHDRIIKYVTYF